jgi:hypothetical protein
VCSSDLYFSYFLPVSGNKNLVLFVSSLHHSTFILLFAPDAGEGGLDLLLEAGDQFAGGGDQCLLGFDLGDDSLLLFRLPIHELKKGVKLGDTFG